jgi:hypothetical protein
MLERCPTGNINEVIVPVSTIDPRTELPESWPSREEIIEEKPDLEDAPDYIDWVLEAKKVPKT